VITRRLAILLLLAFAALRVAAREPSLVGGAPVDTVDLRLAPAAISAGTLRGGAKDSPAASLTSRRYVPRRKGRAAWRSPRREWGDHARRDVTEHGELPRLAGLATGSRVAITFYTLGRSRDDDRGPPVS
jgi:hypothetical protein